MNISVGYPVNGAKAEVAETKAELKKLSLVFFYPEMFYLLVSKTLTQRFSNISPSRHEFVFEQCSQAV